MIDSIARKVTEGRRPLDIFAEMQPDTSADRLTAHPRDVRQVRNQKYRVDRASRGPSGSQPYSNTFADHVLAVGSMVHDKPQFVQDTLLQSAVPSIVLYLRKKLWNLPRLCVAGRKIQQCLALIAHSTWGTFTSLSHRSNIKAFCEKQQKNCQHPIVIGPMLLHGTATFEIYHHFLLYSQQSWDFTP